MICRTSYIPFLNWSLKITMNSEHVSPLSWQISIIIANEVTGSRPLSINHSSTCPFFPSCASHRGGMVQTGEQYEFIHRAVALYESTLPAVCVNKWCTPSDSYHALPMNISWPPPQRSMSLGQGHYWPGASVGWKSRFTRQSLQAPHCPCCHAMYNSQQVFTYVLSAPNAYRGHVTICTACT